MAGKEGHAAMESPQAPIAPLEKGYPLKKSAWMIRGFKKSSSDDRPGPGICGSKYVEDAKAARSVRVWDRVPMKNRDLTLFHHLVVILFARERLRERDGGIA